MENQEKETQGNPQPERGNIFAESAYPNFFGSLNNAQGGSSEIQGMSGVSSSPFLSFTDFAKDKLSHVKPELSDPEKIAHLTNAFKLTPEQGQRLYMGDMSDNNIKLALSGLYGSRYQQAMQVVESNNDPSSIVPEMTMAGETSKEIEDTIRLSAKLSKLRQQFDRQRQDITTEETPTEPGLLEKIGSKVLGGPEGALKVAKGLSGITSAAGKVMNQVEEATGDVIGTGIGLAKGVAANELLKGLWLYKASGAKEYVEEGWEGTEKLINMAWRDAANSPVGDLVDKSLQTLNLIFSPVAGAYRGVKTAMQGGSAVDVTQAMRRESVLQAPMFFGKDAYGNDVLKDTEYLEKEGKFKDIPQLLIERGWPEPLAYAAGVVDFLPYMFSPNMAASKMRATKDGFAKGMRAFATLINDGVKLGDAEGLRQINNYLSEVRYRHIIGLREAKIRETLGMGKKPVLPSATGVTAMAAEEIANITEDQIKSKVIRNETLTDAENAKLEQIALDNVEGKKPVETPLKTTPNASEMPLKTPETPKPSITTTPINEFETLSASEEAAYSQFKAEGSQNPAYKLAEDYKGDSLGKEIVNTENAVNRDILLEKNLSKVSEGETAFTGTIDEPGKKKMAELENLYSGMMGKVEWESYKEQLKTAMKKDKDIERLVERITRKQAAKRQKAWEKALGDILKTGQGKPSKVTKFLNDMEINGTHKYYTKLIQLQDDLPIAGILDVITPTAHKLEGLAGETIIDDFLASDHRLVKAKKMFFDAEAKKVQELGLKPANMKRIGPYMAGQRPLAKQVLEKMGIKPIPESALTMQEKAYIKHLRERYAAFENMINESLIAQGKKPMGHVDDYFTINQFLTNQENSGSIISAIDDVGSFLGGEVKSGLPGFIKKARGGAVEMELDPLKVMHSYATRAYSLIYEADMVRNLKATADAVRQTHPNWSKAIMGVADHMQTYMKPSTINKIRRNIYLSTLAFNWKSMVNQFASIPLITAEVPAKDMYRGLSRMVTGRSVAPKAFALDPRQYGQAFEDFADTSYMISRGWWHKVAEKGMVPMQGVDKMVAEVAYNMLYEKGVSAGLAEKAALRYADRETVKIMATPRKWNVAPWQRTEVGKWFTMFNTVAMSEFATLRKSVIKDPVKFMKWATAVGVYNYLSEDTVGMSSIFPRPIHQLLADIEDPKMEGKWMQSVANVFIELIKPIPVAGGRMRMTGRGMEATPALLGTLGGLIKREESFVSNSVKAIQEPDPVKRKLYRQKAAYDFSYAIAQMYGFPLTSPVTKIWKEIIRMQTPEIQAQYGTRILNSIRRATWGEMGEQNERLIKEEYWGKPDGMAKGWNRMTKDEQNKKYKSLDPYERVQLLHHLDIIDLNDVNTLPKKWGGYGKETQQRLLDAMPKYWDKTSKETKIWFRDNLSPQQRKRLAEDIRWYRDNKK